MITIFLFKIFFLKNIINKNSILIRLLILLFYNNNLSFYNNKLSTLEIYNLHQLRFNKYPILFLIHNKLNFIFFKNQCKNLLFKNKYSIYKFLNKKFFCLNLYNNNNFSLINYSEIQNIIKNNINSIYLTHYTILYYNIFKNSLSDKNISVELINLNYTTTTSLNFFTKNNIFQKFNLNFINYLIYMNKLKFNYKKLININGLLKQKLSSIYLIKFSASNIVKYLTDKTILKSNILFLRKNKIFNKSRYSRNRQTYRTGAY